MDTTSSSLDVMNVLFQLQAIQIREQMRWKAQMEAARAICSLADRKDTHILVERKALEEKSRIIADNEWMKELTERRYW